MKKSAFAFLATLLLLSCGNTPKSDFTVTVKNSLNIERTDEKVEIPMADITARLPLTDDGQYIVTDKE